MNVKIFRKESINDSIIVPEKISLSEDNYVEVFNDSNSFNDVKINQEIKNYINDKFKLKPDDIIILDNYSSYYIINEFLDLIRIEVRI